MTTCFLKIAMTIACEQAPSEVEKKFGERSEWKSERRDSALGSSRSPLTTLGYLALNLIGSLFAVYYD